MTACAACLDRSATRAPCTARPQGQGTDSRLQSRAKVGRIRLAAWDSTIRG